MAYVVSEQVVVFYHPLLDEFSTASHYLKGRHENQQKVIIRQK